MLSDPKPRRTSQCEATYATVIQHCEKTCHPAAKRVSDQINGTTQVELVEKRVIVDHIIQHRIDFGVVVSARSVFWTEPTGEYPENRSSCQRHANRPMVRRCPPRALRHEFH